MARYYFHSRDGGVHRDLEGTDLPDDQHARVEALKALGELLLDQAATLEDVLLMEVTNGQGRSLYRLELAVTPTPPAGPDR